MGYEGNVLNDSSLIYPENCVGKLEAFATVTVDGYAKGEISKEEYDKMREDKRK